MAIRTLSQIIQDAITFILSKQPNAATFEGSVIRDVVIESPAQEFNNVYTELSHTQLIQSIEFADQLTQDELDALATNYGLVRLPGTQSQGTITFRIRNYTGTSAIITVPTGTTIATQATTTIPAATFTTTAGITFNPALAPSYFNPATGFYEQTTTIVSTSIGANTNVAAGTITQLVSSAPGIDTVINTTATTGGTDIESNTAFAKRIQVKLSGNNVGTPNGIISLMKANPLVTDAIVVTPNDPEMLRSQFGGEVDVYILGTSLATTFDLQVYSVTGAQFFILEHQPVTSVTSVTGLVGGLTHTFIQGVDYNFVKDTSVLFTGSTQEESKIQFLGATVPDDGTQITITYVYDELMDSLQLSINQDTSHIITADNLVREANKAFIDVQADVTMFPGFSAANVIAGVQTALTNFINGLGLGKSINRSDIIAVIEGVDGVDSVNVDTLELFKNGVLLPINTQKLVIFKTEYAVANTLTINIV